MPKITAIETAIPAGIMPNLVLVRIHTDDGFIGCGETYYTPHAIAALVHDWMAARLLGADADDAGEARALDDLRACHVHDEIDPMNAEPCPHGLRLHQSKRQQ